MFNETIVRHFSNPEFAAELDDATASIELGNPVCGDRISVQLKITDGHVRKARYQAWGCATSLAAGNVFCAHVNDQPLAAIATSGAAIDSMLGELEPSQHHCLEMLRALFAELPKRAQ
jgi:nitrogen fixation NifU-like protein